MWTLPVLLLLSLEIREALALPVSDVAAPCKYEIIPAVQNITITYHNK